MKWSKRDWRNGMGEEGEVVARFCVEAATLDKDVTVGLASDGARALAFRSIFLLFTSE